MTTRKSYLSNQLKKDEKHDFNTQHSELSSVYTPALRQQHRINMTLKNKIPAKQNTSNGMSYLNVFIYGYCYREGLRGSRGGYGVYIEGTAPNDTTRNVSSPVSLYTKQTSKVASLLAIEEALETRIVRRAFKNPKIQTVIYVDDPYTLLLHMF